MLRSYSKTGRYAEMPAHAKRQAQRSSIKNDEPTNTETAKLFNINWKAQNMRLPFIPLSLLLGCGYLIIDIFYTEITLETQAPWRIISVNASKAQIKNDGISGKYANMQKSFGEDCAGFLCRRKIHDIEMMTNHRQRNMTQNILRRSLDKLDAAAIEQIKRRLNLKRENYVRAPIEAKMTEVQQNTCNLSGNRQANS